MRDIGSADAVLADNPRLTLFVELLTVAHVAGLARPVRLSRALLPDDVHGRIRECVVAEVVTRAVTARAPLIRADYEPQTLAEHVASTVTRVLAGGAPSCPVTSEIRWQAGRYRFADVPQALHEWRGPRDRPHPMTAAWRDRGLALSGVTMHEQLLSYAARPSSRMPASALLWGGGRLATAIDQLSGAADVTERLIDASRFLRVPGDWHQYVFRLAVTADGPFQPGGLRD